MTHGFREATTKRIKLRMSIQSAYKAGKTLTSMVIMDGLLRRLKELGELEGNGRFAVGDSEKRSSERYAKRKDGSGYSFAVKDIVRGDVPEFIQCLDDMEAAGFSGGMLDSISPEWSGKHGIIAGHGELVENKSKSGRANSFALWGEAKKPHAAFIDRIIAADLHLICTMRCKIKHQQDPAGGIIRMGWKPIQNEEMPFEFDILAEMNHKHQLKIIGSRFRAIDNLVFDPLGTVGATNPIENLGALIADWLTDGGAATEREALSSVGGLDPATVAEILSLKEQWGVPDDKWMGILTNNYAASRVEDIDPEKAKTLIANMRAKVAAKMATQGGAVGVVTSAGMSADGPTATVVIPPASTRPVSTAPVATPAPPPSSGPPIAPALTPEQRQEMIEEISAARVGMGMPDAAFQKALEKRGVQGTGELQDDELEEFRDKMEDLWNRKRADAASKALEPSPQAPGGLSPDQLADIVDGPPPETEDEAATDAMEIPAGPVNPPPAEKPKRQRTKAAKA